jgi:transcriptional regulator with XRE-family HTH domain
MSAFTRQFREQVPGPPPDLQAESIGQRLKRLRLERGLSQRDLSAPGVSYAYISRIEAGARTPSVKALRMLAQKLGVSVEYLETGRDLRDTDERELRLADAELELRLGDDTSGSEKKLREVLAESMAAGDHPSARRARIALGLASARRGNHLDAVQALEAALDDGIVDPAARPDVFAALGQSYAFLGAPERAVRLFEKCLEDLNDGSVASRPARIWFGTLLSYALTDAGDYARAREVIFEALSNAEEGADPYTRVRLYWSQARLAHHEGRGGDALASIRQAIALLKTTDDDVYLARAYLLRAGVETNQGDADAARRDLTSARHLLAARAEPVDRGMIHIGDSRVAFLEGDSERAIDDARKAIDILGEFHAGEQGEAIWALARGYSLAGDVAGADQTFSRAVDLLSVHGRRHDAARAAADWAEMLGKAGRTNEAARASERAASLGLDLDLEAARKL